MSNSSLHFSERLKSAMVSAGYLPRPAVLEREFNLRWHGKPMTLHGVRRWLLGETIPGQDKILVLAEWLGISPQLLRYGAEVEQRIEDRQTQLEQALRSQERDVIAAYLNLPQIQRKAIREIIMALTEKMNLDSATSG
jgi:hypothetical protein